MGAWHIGRIGLAAACLLAGSAIAVPPEAPPDAMVWSRVIPELEEIRELRDRHDQLPAWHPWRNTQKKNRERIDAMLDDVVEILGISPVRNVREEIEHLERTNTEDEGKIAALKEKRISAPSESIFGATVERIDLQICTLYLAQGGCAHH